MNRTIFLRELRVGLIQDFMVSGAVLTFAAGGWLAVSASGHPFREIGEALSTILALVVGMLAFSSGVRTFTAESQRRQELFLGILPISRTSLWLSMVGGRFASAGLTAALPFLVLVGLSFVGSSPDLDTISLFGFPLFVTMFAAGSCLPLLFRSDLVHYLAGLGIVLPVLFQVMAFAYWDARSDFLSASQWIISTGLLSAVFLLHSWIFFRRGECLVRTRQLANLASLAGALIFLLLLVGEIALSPLLNGVAGPWLQDSTPRNSPSKHASSTARRVSADGRYLAIVETLQKRPTISRVVVVETATGRRIGESRWRNLERVSWHGRNKELRILSSEEAFPFFWRVFDKPMATVWSRLTPDGREISRLRFGRIIDLAELPDGTFVLLDQKGETVRLILLAEPWSTPILAEGRRLTQFEIFVPGFVAAFPRIWRVEAGRAKEVSLHDWTALWMRMSSQQRELAQKAGAGPPPIWDGSQSLAAMRHAMKELPFVYKGDADIGLYLPARGLEGHAILFDGALDQEIPLPGCNHSPSTAPELTPATSSPRFLARFQCLAGTASGQAAVSYRHFSYLPGSGVVTPLPDLDSALAGDIDIRLAYLDEHTAIWRPGKGETWKILRNGQVRTLWPPQSGE